ncbi:Membrane associated, signal transduction histidine kinase-like ATPase [Acidisarcina polymorpha]|uniref:Membrane associated, signal transduction histidine kinase-like ATPase n=1 Tax=Acidisarcina polymorpha TaxID=2211140 RepID=A0A2Z5FTJ6_9BACT|nr:sensor histidine kinase [Acidisarcina polymorpha]AXC10169.1 Membrane associated, signal transduction histidine kinase-like ATPase [Acidisarcina polymorpha]
MKTSRSLALGLTLLLATCSARAVDANTRISQYGHTVWRIQDGVFSGAPNAIAQTTDGYLWIGTQNGLVRFDGVRFVPWIPPKGKLLSSGIFALLAARDGGLWIGTSANLAHLQNGNLTNYMDGQGRINSIIQGHDGRIWITRSRVHDDKGPLCEVQDTSLRCYGVADGINSPYAGPLAEDSEGSLWFGSASLLTRWSAGSSTVFTPSASKSGEGLSGVQAIVAAPDGSIWSGRDRRGPGLGLQRLVHGVSTPLNPTLHGSALQVSALFLDRQDALWIGTEDQGIYRLRGNKVDRFSSVDGLSSDSVSGFYEDREGNMWVATTEGIDCFRNERVTTFSTRQGLSANLVDSVLAAGDGTIWIGNLGALEYLRGDRLSSIQSKDGLPGQRVTSLLEDHAGRLWVGLEDRLYVYEDGRFDPIRRSNNIAIGTVIAMTEDRETNVWAEVIGSPAKLLRIQGREVREELPAPGMPAATSLAADPKGGIWLGLVDGNLARYRQGRLETFSPGSAAGSQVREMLIRADGSVLGATSSGLIEWKDGRLRTLTNQNGLPCNSLYGLVADNNNALWLYAQCGLVRVADTELREWWNGAKASVKAETFDMFDGARPWSAAFQPHGSRSPDGRLWFANENVVQMIDPSHLETNSLPPPVHIEQIVADRKNYSPTDQVRLPALTRDLEIDYTALSFVVPGKVRFRYKLEGRDRDWQDPMTRRQAFYSDLPPGTYQFRIIACNNDGVWNEEGAILDFSIAPMWYQMAWFRIFCFAFVMLIGWILHRIRVWQVSMAIGVRFDERLAERTRMARELHDTFLQTIQGSKFVVDDGLEEPLNTEKMHRALRQVSGWLEQAITEGRAALNSLRSSTTLKNELGPALRQVAESGVVPEGMTISASVIGDAQELHPIVRDELYRIGHEAILNAKAHSHGSYLEIGLTYGHDLTLHVRDNGVGIDPSYAMSGREGHHGLQGMRERAARIQGRLTILSSAESGTDISVIVPGSVSFLHPGTGIFSRIRHLYRRAIRNHDPL